MILWLLEFDNKFVGVFDDVEKAKNAPVTFGDYDLRWQYYEDGDVYKAESYGAGEYFWSITEIKLNRIYLPCL